MRAFTTDHLEEQPRRGWRRLRIHRSFHLLKVPRPVPVCRLFGHRHVVDGIDPLYEGGPAQRWVVCSRCGARPDPQGRLSPLTSSVGDRYRGRFLPLPHDPKERQEALLRLKDADLYPPGSDVPAVGEVTVEVSARRWGGLGVSVSLWPPGSDDTVVLALRGGLLSVYVSLRGFFGGLQHRTRFPGTEPREWELATFEGLLTARWGSWARSIPVNPLDVLLGPRLYRYAEAGQRDTTTITVPGSDTRYQLQLVLKEVEYGRKRWRKKHSWSVDWTTLNPEGLPSGRPGRGVVSSAVQVSETAVQTGTWRIEATNRIIAWAKAEHARAAR